MLVDLAWRVARPALFQLDAERAHRTVLETLERWPRLTSGLLGSLLPAPTGGLETTIGPLSVRSPLGLAAGLDKDGEAAHAWAAMGFGFVELGTVTPRPQAGNPQPRLFRLPDDGALINRMGFNNGGAEALRARLVAMDEQGTRPDVPIGANVGKNKDTPNNRAEEDYLAGVQSLEGLVDWFTVNVSSPNTPGLRDLQEPERLRRLLSVVVDAATDTPVFLKLAPDLEPSAMAEAVGVAIDAGCSGLIATNTTISRPGTTNRLGENGGLSGRPLWPLARERIATVIAATQGRVPVIGVGGVSTPDQVEELLALGCAGVQVYTALIYEGPGFVHRVLQHLAASTRASA